MLAHDTTTNKFDHCLLLLLSRARLNLGLYTMYNIELSRFNPGLV